MGVILTAELPISTYWEDCYKLSLGGLLTLRAEIGLAFSSNRNIVIHTNRVFSEKEEQLIQLVFTGYKVGFEDISDSQPWPTEELRSNSEPGFENFDRLSLLVKTTSRKPSLNWSNEILDAARKFRNQICGKVCAVHLKYAPDGKREESHADLDVWCRFFSEQAVNNIQFVILGNDPVQDVFSHLPNVHIAESDDLGLLIQLAFVQYADLFLGMASGICQAAIFSDIPYAIFKHPKHHAQEMESLLGSHDQLSFSGKQQFFIRRDPDMSILQNAWEALL